MLELQYIHNFCTNNGILVCSNYLELDILNTNLYHIINTSLRYLNRKRILELNMVRKTLEDYFDFHANCIHICIVNNVLGSKIRKLHSLDLSKAYMFQYQLTHILKNNINKQFFILNLIIKYIVIYKIFMYIYLSSLTFV